MLNFGHETEELAFEDSTGDLYDAMIDIVAMLNKHGNGNLYFGVLSNGDVKGCRIVDETLRFVSRVISESIKPQIFPRITKITLDGRDILEVMVDGENKPYSAYGKYYIRVAGESRECNPESIQA